MLADIGGNEKNVLERERAYKPKYILMSGWGEKGPFLKDQDSTVSTQGSFGGQNVTDGFGEMISGRRLFSSPSVSGGDALRGKEEEDEDVGGSD